jgi:hypothetical protein
LLKKRFCCTGGDSSGTERRYAVTEPIYPSDKQNQNPFDCEAHFSFALLCGQALSALCSSALQNVSAVLCSHSLAESVLLHSLPFLRLISLFHNFTS